MHLQNQYARLLKASFFPAGHGKGPVDGHFGRMTHDAKATAKKKILAEVSSYVSALRARCKARQAKDPKSPICVFIAFEPARKSSLPKTVLNSALLRDAEMGLKTTLAYSSEKTTVGVRLFRHPVAGHAHDKHCWAPLAKGGDDLDDADATGEWKRYYRTARPDQMKLKIGSLLRSWRRERTSGLELQPRRKSLQERTKSAQKANRQKTERKKVLANAPCWHGWRQRFKLEFFKHLVIQWRQRFSFVGDNIDDKIRKKTHTHS